MFKVMRGVCWQATDSEERKEGVYGLKRMWEVGDRKGAERI